MKTILWMRKSILSLILVMLVIWPYTASSQSISVLAVVDGTPITSLDFQQRRNFLIKTTGIEDTSETKAQIDRDVLQMLIDDVIKVNEGLRLGPQHETQAKARASELVNQSFAQNGDDAATVLARLDINRETAEKKFYADVLWASTVQTRFSSQFAEAKNEAQKELGRIQKNTQKPQVSLDEIILLPDAGRNFSATKELANQIYDALGKGADFGRIAQQYSAAGSGRVGGAIGWVQIDRLPESVRPIAETAPRGTITRPINLDGALVIYRIKGRRIDGAADPLEARVTLARLAYPADLEKNLAAATAQLRHDLISVSSCPELVALHKTYGADFEAEMGAFTLSDLPPQLQRTITPLESGEISDILNYDGGLAVFMVCDKELPQLSLPTVTEIENSIHNRYFTALSARHLSRLRKKAVITYSQRP